MSMVGCTCVGAWFGVIPPPCPLHNPVQLTQLIATDSVTYWPERLTPVPESKLGDDDVERIAQRVAELLRRPT